MSRPECYQCRDDANRKTFQTFTYWFCERCRVELDDSGWPVRYQDDMEELDKKNSTEKV